MTTAADAVRDLITPLLDGWRIQFGRWTDGSKADRFAVIKPAGGMPVELVRRPQFTLTLVGAENDPPSEINEFADLIIEAMRSDSGDIVSMQPAEPVPMATNDGRPVFEIAISAITV